MKRPHVVVIMWHDLGTYLRCYGVTPTPSPRLDGLASEGAALTNYFASYPVCCPSRAGMMTGLIAHANGVSGQINRGWDMSRDLAPLPRIFRDSGYETCLTSFSHECRDPVWEGYDRVENVADAQKSDFVDRYLETRGEEPLFLTVNTQAVHRPFGDEHDADLTQKVDVPEWMPDDPSTRVDLACFHRHVSESDAFTGRILDSIDRHLNRDNTITIFTTDHGMPFA